MLSLVKEGIYSICLKELNAFSQCWWLVDFPEFGGEGCGRDY